MSSKKPQPLRNPRHFATTLLFSLVVVMVSLVGVAPGAVSNSTKPSIPQITSAPSSVSASQQAVVVAQVAPNIPCQLSLSKGHRAVRSPAKRATTGVLEFVWSVPPAVRSGRYTAVLSCRRKHHRARVAITAQGPSGSRGQPLARHIKVLVIRDSEPPAVHGLGAGTYPGYGNVMVPASAWFGGHGVDVHSNGFGDNVCQTNLPCYWQCVELVNRFDTSERFGPTIYGNANQIYADADPRYYDHHPNGSGYIPIPGDIVTLGGGKFGHVAVVSGVIGSGVYIAEQNASASGTALLTLTGSTLSGEYGMSVIGVLHAKANTSPVTGPIPPGPYPTPPSPGPPVPPPLPNGGKVRGTFSADVNGDGKTDLVAVDEKATFVMLSTGSGFSAPAQWSSVPFYGTRGTFTGDVNGDGKTDLVAVNDSATFVMLSTGSGFSAPAQWSSVPFYGS
jgi:surface antigen